jgi:integrase
MQQKGVGVFSLAQTFDREAAAKAWIKKKESELRQPGALAAAIASQGQPRGGVTLGDAIERALTDRVKDVGQATKDNLRQVRRRAIAKIACEGITSRDLTDLARELYVEGRKPATVGNIMSSLSKVFVLAEPVWGYDLDEREMERAVAGCRELGLIGRSSQRKRRPELDELDRLFLHFEQYESRRIDALPMRRLTAFGIFSTRRLGETCRLLWKDYNPDHTEGPQILVRNMKHPGEKNGNDVWCRLTPEAVAIIDAMPRVAERIFPYNEATASTNWTRACKVLGIEDLKYRDTRRDGISHLLEMGWNHAVVMSFSGHRALSAPEHYVSLKNIDGYKYENWRWFTAVTEPFKREAAEILLRRRHASRRGSPQDLGGTRVARPSDSAPSASAGAGSRRSRFF